MAKSQKPVPKSKWETRVAFVAAVVGGLVIIEEGLTKIINGAPALWTAITGAQEPKNQKPTEPRKADKAPAKGELVKSEELSAFATSGPIQSQICIKSGSGKFDLNTASFQFTQSTNQSLTSWTFTKMTETEICGSLTVTIAAKQHPQAARGFISVLRLPAS